MPIPNFQIILLPLLIFASDEKPHTLQDSIKYLADYFKLSESEEKELLPSGKQTIFLNRVGWSRTYLKKAGLLEYPTRSFFKITTRGLDLLKTKPDKITISLLKQYPEFLDFVGNSNLVSKKSDDIINIINVIEDNEQTPEEV